MKKIIILLIFLGVLGAIAWHYLKPTSSVVAETIPTPTPTTNALLAAIETDYTDQAQVNANAQQGTSILFFYSTTDAQSQASQQDIVANAAEVPAGAKFFKVNYDTENILKDKYNVKTPDSFVIVNATGSVTHQWTGGGVDKLTSEMMGN